MCSPQIPKKCSYITPNLIVSIRFINIFSSLPFPPPLPLHPSLLLTTYSFYATVKVFLWSASLPPHPQQTSYQTSSSSSRLTCPPLYHHQPLLSKALALSVLSPALLPAVCGNLPQSPPCFSHQPSSALLPGGHRTFFSVHLFYFFIFFVHCHDD